MCNSNKQHVIVLMDIENRKSKFLYNLGKIIKYQHICETVNIKENVIFNYEIFGLMTKEINLGTLISNIDGIIFLVDCSNISEHHFKQIKHITDNYAELPMLLVIEKNNDTSIFPNNVEKCIDTSSNDRQIFTIDYTKSYISEIIAARNWFSQSIKQNKK